MRPKEFFSKHYEIVDLSNLVTNSSPTWFDTPGGGFTPTLATTFPYDDPTFTYRWYTLHMHQNIGTHIDSPSHFIHHGKPAAQLDLRDMTNIPACVFDIRDKVQKSEDYQLTVEDIKEWESNYEKVGEGALVLLLSGWDKYWCDTVKYRNVSPVDGKMHFPVYSLEAARFLVYERGVRGLGIDNLSPEVEKDLPIHKMVLGESKYLVENLCNLDKLPPTGSIVSVAPLKLDQLSESPVRAYGMVFQ